LDPQRIVLQSVYIVDKEVDVKIVEVVVYVSIVEEEVDVKIVGAVVYVSIVE
jgi:hypothetical protein